MVATQKTLEPDLIAQMLKRPVHGKVTSCIQCGVCSGSCPNAGLMTYPPHKVVAMLNAGMGDRVLASNTPWYCSACYLCTLRCPQEIPVTDYMYSLKNMALRSGAPVGDKNTATMSTLFTDGVSKNGKNNEMSLLVQYQLRTNLLGSISMAPLGQALFRKGRLKLRGEKVKDLKGFRAIVEKARELGEQA